MSRSWPATLRGRAGLYALWVLATAVGSLGGPLLGAALSWPLQPVLGALSSSEIGAGRGC